MKLPKTTIMVSRLPIDCFNSYHKTVNFEIQINAIKYDLVTIMALVRGSFYYSKSIINRSIGSYLYMAISIIQNTTINASVQCSATC